MKIAILQPYFFPYIGYWQLIHAVDRFVIYDDVNYIKRGWINRNRILINGKATYIILPLSKSSQNKKIYEIELHSSPVLRNKLVKTIQNTYRKSFFFDQVFPVIEKLIRYKVDNLSDYLSYQLQSLASFMGIKTEFIATSRSYWNDYLSGQERVLDICNREQATTYFNLPGGQALYSGEEFRRAGVNLRFISMRTLPYTQRITGFIPYLSIIDALMEIGPTGFSHHLNAFEIITG
jgi:hypothetical protein